jgi:hypothetical protein
LDALNTLFVYSCVINTVVGYAGNYSNNFSIKTKIKIKYLRGKWFKTKKEEKRDKVSLYLYCNL